MSGNQKQDGRCAKNALVMSRRHFVGGSAALAAASALSMPTIARAQQAPIRIGFPVPLTGPYGSEANDQVRCAQIAIDQFNASGGLNGRMAELLVRDDKLNPGEAATRALELIEKDNVDCIVGALSTSVQLAVNEVTKARGVLYNSISQSDTINEIKDFSKFTFHEALNPHMTAGAVGGYVFSKFKKRVAYLTADYAFGDEIMRGYRRVGKAMGVEELVEVRHPLGAQDFSIFFPKIQAAKPDVLIVNNFGRDQLNFLKQAADYGIGKSMQVVCTLLSHTQRMAGGADIYEGVIGGANYYWELEKQFPSAKAFNDAYRAKHNNAVPSDYGAYGYVAVRAMLEGFRKAGGTTNKDAFIAALEEKTYDYYKGPQVYRKCDHQSAQSVIILKSRKKSEMKGEYDVYETLTAYDMGPDKLRTCQELGHPS